MNLQLIVDAKCVCGTGQIVTKQKGHVRYIVEKTVVIYNPDKQVIRATNGAVFLRTVDSASLAICSVTENAPMQMDFTDNLEGLITFLKEMEERERCSD